MCSSDLNKAKGAILSYRRFTRLVLGQFILLPRGIVIDSIGFGRLLELAVVALNLPSHNTKNFIAMVCELVTSKCYC